VPAQVTANNEVWNYRAEGGGFNPGPDDIKKVFLGRVEDMIDLPITDMGGVPISDLQESFEQYGLDMSGNVMTFFKDMSDAEDRLYEYPPEEVGAPYEVLAVRVRAVVQSTWAQLCVREQLCCNPPNVGSQRTILVGAGLFCRRGCLLQGRRCSGRPPQVCTVAGTSPVCGLWQQVQSANITYPHSDRLPQNMNC
jgi:hypothetical protein